MAVKFARKKAMSLSSRSPTKPSFIFFQGFWLANYKARKLLKIYDSVSKNGKRAQRRSRAKLVEKAVLIVVNPVCDGLSDITRQPVSSPSLP